jgi:hypothetical protein
MKYFIFTLFSLCFALSNSGHTQEGTDGSNKESLINNGELQLLSDEELEKLYFREPTPNVVKIDQTTPEAMAEEPVAETATPLPAETPQTIPPSQSQQAAEEITPEQITQPDQIEASEPQPTLPPNIRNRSSIAKKERSDISGFSLSNAWRLPSIMISTEELSTLNAATRSYLRSLLPDEPVEEEEEVAEEEEEIEIVEYPFITVDSIMYVDENNWASWINGTKFSPGNLRALPQLRLDKITPKSVTIEWEKPGAIQKEKLEAISGEITDDPGIRISTDGKVLTNSEARDDIILPGNVVELGGDRYLITLSSNQAFITEDFSMHEGRAVSKKIRELLKKIKEKENAEKQTAEIDTDDPSPFGGLAGNDPRENTPIENLTELKNLYDQYLINPSNELRPGRR